MVLQSPFWLRCLHLFFLWRAGRGRWPERLFNSGCFSTCRPGPRQWVRDSLRHLFKCPYDRKASWRSSHCLGSNWGYNKQLEFPLQGLQRLGSNCLGSNWGYNKQLEFPLQGSNGWVLQLFGLQLGLQQAVGVPTAGLQRLGSPTVWAPTGATTSSWSSHCRAPTAGFSNCLGSNWGYNKQLEFPLQGSNGWVLQLFGLQLGLQQAVGVPTAGLQRLGSPTVWAPTGATTSSWSSHCRAPTAGFSNCLGSNWGYNKQLEFPLQGSNGWVPTVWAPTGATTSSWSSHCRAPTAGFQLFGLQLGLQQAVGVPTAGLQRLGSPTVCSPNWGYNKQLEFPLQGSNGWVPIVWAPAVRLQQAVGVPTAGLQRLGSNCLGSTWGCNKQLEFPLQSSNCWVPILWASTGPTTSSWSCHWGSNGWVPTVWATAGLQRLGSPTVWAPTGATTSSWSSHCRAPTAGFQLFRLQLWGYNKQLEFPLQGWGYNKQLEFPLQGSNSWVPIVWAPAVGLQQAVGVPTAELQRLGSNCLGSSCGATTSSWSSLQRLGSNCLGSSCGATTSSWSSHCRAPTAGLQAPTVGFQLFWLQLWGYNKQLEFPLQRLGSNCWAPQLWGYNKQVEFPLQGSNGWVPIVWAPAVGLQQAVGVPTAGLQRLGSNCLGSSCGATTSSWSSHCRSPTAGFQLFGLQLWGYNKQLEFPLQGSNGWVPIVWAPAVGLQQAVGVPTAGLQRLGSNCLGSSCGATTSSWSSHCRAPTAGFQLFGLQLWGYNKQLEFPLQVSNGWVPIVWAPAVGLQQAVGVPTAGLQRLGSNCLGSSCGATTSSWSSHCRSPTAGFQLFGLQLWGYNKQLEFPLQGSNGWVPIVWAPAVGLQQAVGVPTAGLQRLGSNCLGSSCGATTSSWSSHCRSPTAGFQLFGLQLWGYNSWSSHCRSPTAGFQLFGLQLWGYNKQLEFPLQVSNGWVPIVWAPAVKLQQAVGVPTAGLQRLGSNCLGSSCGATTSSWSSHCRSPTAGFQLFGLQLWGYNKQLEFPLQGSNGWVPIVWAPAVGLQQAVGVPTAGLQRLGSNCLDSSCGATTSSWSSHCRAPTAGFQLFGLQLWGYNKQLEFPLQVSNGWVPIVWAPAVGLQQAVGVPTAGLQRLGSNCLGSSCGATTSSWSSHCRAPTAGFQLFGLQLWGYNKQLEFPLQVSNGVPIVWAPAVGLQQAVGVPTAGLQRLGSNCLGSSCGATTSSWSSHCRSPTAGFQLFGLQTVEATASSWSSHCRAPTAGFQLFGLQLWGYNKQLEFPLCGLQLRQTVGVLTAGLQQLGSSTLWAPTVSNLAIPILFQYSACF